MEASGVTVNMQSYMETMLFDAPEDMKGEAATPAANHLFNAGDEDTLQLEGEQNDIFVHFVMQALYLSQCGHPNIKTAVSFLCG